MSRVRPMVMLDLRMVRSAPHGIARYASALARHLPALAPDLDIVALRSRGDAVEGVPNRTALVPFLAPWEQIEVPLRTLASGAALFHATSFSVPRWMPSPLVLTLHDAIHLAVDEESSPLKRTYYRHVVRPAALAAKAVLTVSSFSRNELARSLEIDAARITVIPNGVDEKFLPPTAEQVARVRQRYRLPEVFALYVGNSKPHKNLEVLVQAERILGRRVPVFLAGDDEAGRKLALTPDQSLRNLGVVPEGDLPALYGACTVFVFPSKYEGAGLPPLEAMACGAPVISSNAASMPELLGEAAAYFSPGDVGGLASLVDRVVEDAGFRKQLVSRGRAQSARYTWRTCAEKTADVYRHALDGVHRPASPA